MNNKGNIDWFIEGSDRIGYNINNIKKRLIITNLSVALSVSIFDSDFGKDSWVEGIVDGELEGEVDGEEDSVGNIVFVQLPYPSNNPFNISVIISNFIIIDWDLEYWFERLTKREGDNNKCMQNKVKNNKLLTLGIDGSLFGKEVKKCFIFIILIVLS